MSSEVKVKISKWNQQFDKNRRISSVCLDYHSLIPSSHAVSQSLPTAPLDQVIITCNPPDQLISYNLNLIISITKNGLLCESNCARFKSELMRFKDSMNELQQQLPSSQSQEINAILKIDFENMILAGGITYYLPTQLQLLENCFNLSQLTLDISQQSFNTQCLSAIAPCFSALKHLKGFKLSSKMKQTPISFLEQLPAQVTLVEIKLCHEPAEGGKKMINILKRRFDYLDDLSLHLSDASEDTICELKQMLNELTLLKSCSLGLKWNKEMFWEDKNRFYNNLSACLAILEKKKVKLRQFHLDLSPLEDSRLKIDILEELLKESMTSGITELKIYFPDLKGSLKTDLIAFLYKIASVIKAMKSLQFLEIKLQAPNKFHDIISESMKNCNSKVIIIDIINQSDTQCPLEIEFPKESQVVRVQGIRLSPSAIPKYLLEYKVQNSQKNDEDQLIRQIVSKRDYLVSVLAVTREMQLFKRKEILIDMVQNYLISNLIL